MRANVVEQGNFCANCATLAARLTLLQAEFPATSQSCVKSLTHSVSKTLYVRRERDMTSSISPFSLCLSKNCCYVRVQVQEKWPRLIKKRKLFALFSVLFLRGATHAEKGTKRGYPYDMLYHRRPAGAGGGEGGRALLKNPHKFCSIIPNLLFLKHDDSQRNFGPVMRRWWKS